MLAWLLKRNKYGKRRIVKETVDEYLLKNYGVKDAVCTKEKVLGGFAPLLQNDYGVDNCCSIASITSAIYHTGALSGSGKKGRPDSVAKNENAEGPRANTVAAPLAKDVFDKVYKNAKLFFFGKRGTNPFLIKPIFDRTLRQSGQRGRTGVAFVKGVGVRFAPITKLIDRGVPLVFSLLRDGNGFYGDHTMLIIGYAVYETGGEKHRFLLLHDNWAKTVSYLDYDRLPPICSVNWRDVR
ncbi:MAG: hypothetical protein J6113_01970 [Lachnospiraceae bacterium]|nr:hypothetical protein [Lachnospiraceae bacterium]